MLHGVILIYVTVIDLFREQILHVVRLSESKDLCIVFYYETRAYINLYYT